MEAKEKSYLGERAGVTESLSEDVAFEPELKNDKEWGWDMLGVPRRGKGLCRNTHRKHLGQTQKLGYLEMLESIFFWLHNPRPPSFMGKNTMSIYLWAAVPTCQDRNERRLYQSGASQDTETTSVISTGKM